MFSNFSFNHRDHARQKVPLDGWLKEKRDYSLSTDGGELLDMDVLFESTVIILPYLDPCFGRECLDKFDGLRDICNNSYPSRNEAYCYPPHIAVSLVVFPSNTQQDASPPAITYRHCSETNLNLSNCTTILTYAVAVKNNNIISYNTRSYQSPFGLVDQNKIVSTYRIYQSKSLNREHCLTRTRQISHKLKEAVPSRSQQNNIRSSLLAKNIKSMKNSQPNPSKPEAGSSEPLLQAEPHSQGYESTFRFANLLAEIKSDRMTMAIINNKKPVIISGSKSQREWTNISTMDFIIATCNSIDQKHLIQLEDYENMKTMIPIYAKYISNLRAFSSNGLHYKITPDQINQLSNLATAAVGEIESLKLSASQAALQTPDDQDEQQNNLANQQHQEQPIAHPSIKRPRKDNGETAPMNLDMTQYQSDTSIQLPSTQKENPSSIAPSSATVENQTQQQLIGEKMDTSVHSDPLAASQQASSTGADSNDSNLQQPIQLEDHDMNGPEDEHESKHSDASSEVEDNQTEEEQALSLPKPEPIARYEVILPEEVNSTDARNLIKKHFGIQPDRKHQQWSFTGDNTYPIQIGQYEIIIRSFMINIYNRSLVQKALRIKLVMTSATYSSNVVFAIPKDVPMTILQLSIGVPIHLHKQNLSTSFIAEKLPTPLSSYRMHVLRSLNGEMLFLTLYPPTMSLSKLKDLVMKLNKEQNMVELGGMLTRLRMQAKQRTAVGKSSKTPQWETKSLDFASIENIKPKAKQPKGRKSNDMASKKKQAKPKSDSTKTFTLPVQAGHKDMSFKHNNTSPPCVTSEGIPK